MRFWVREIVGWVLVALGLVMFFFAFGFLDAGLILEGGPLTLIGIIIFRGGIHLLKVAVAARVCLKAQEKLEQTSAAPGMLAALNRPASRPVVVRR